jgi:porphobilinogen synthase
VPRNERAKRSRLDAGRVYQQSVDKFVDSRREVEGLGLPGVILLACRSRKTRAPRVRHRRTVVQKAVESIRKSKLNLLVITDVCLCEYTITDIAA